jgi:hypothetical protein
MIKNSITGGRRGQREFEEEFIEIANELRKL